MELRHVVEDSLPVKSELEAVSGHPVFVHQNGSKMFENFNHYFFLSANIGKQKSKVNYFIKIR